MRIRLNKVTSFSADIKIHLVLTEVTFLKIHERYLEMQSETKIARGFRISLTDPLSFLVGKAD